MIKARRIDIGLFDKELIDLINASSKIFPISQQDVDTNHNPNDYEYGRIDNAIYRWNGVEWNYIIADDIDISFTELKDIPSAFKPIPHTHTESDIINLNKYTKEELDVIVSRLADKLHKHTEEDIIDLDKYTKEEIDTKLNLKSDTNHTHPYSPIDHDHNTIYANKSVEGEIIGIDQRLFNIENGYTEGHTHPNVDLLNTITSLMISDWNTVLSKADRDYVISELSKKLDKSTFDGHAENLSIHITQEDKNNWNNKTSLTIGTNKPTDGSIWYKEI